MTKEQFAEVKELSKEFPVLEEFIAVFESETVNSYMALQKFQQTMNEMISDADDFGTKSKEREYDRVSKYLLDLDKYDKVGKSLLREIFSDPEKKEEFENKRATEQIPV